MQTIRYAVAALSLAIFPGAAVIAQTAECIGVVHAGGGYTFWAAVGQGAKEAADRLGISVYFRGPPDENSPDAQEKIVQAIEGMHCKGLVLAPDAPQRAFDVVRLKDKGVPTVYIDRDFGDGNAVAVVATDNYRAGRLAGQRLAAALDNKGRVAVFHMKRGVSSTDERERGFIDAARSAGLTIAAEEWIGNSVGEARRNALRALAKMEQPVDGLFTPNESTTRATLVALREAHLGGRVRLVGFDMSPEFVVALKDGTLFGVVMQQPFQMGYQGVTIAYRAAQGLFPEQRQIDTGTLFVTADTLGTPGVACALAPYFPDSRYGTACAASPRVP